MDTRIYIYVSEQHFNKNVVREIVSFSRDSWWTFLLWLKVDYWRAIWFWWPFVSWCFTNLSGDLSFNLSCCRMWFRWQGEWPATVTASWTASRWCWRGRASPLPATPSLLTSQNSSSMPFFLDRCRTVQLFKYSALLLQPFRQIMQCWRQSLHFMKSFSFSGIL